MGQPQLITYQYHKKGYCNIRVFYPNLIGSRNEGRVQGGHVPSRNILGDENIGNGIDEEDYGNEMITPLNPSTLSLLGRQQATESSTICNISSWFPTTIIQ